MSAPRLLLAYLLLLHPTLGAAQPGLRYRLAVGQQLVYERKVVVTPLGDVAATRTDREQIEAWCLPGPNHELLLLLQLSRLSAGHAEPQLGGVLYIDESGRRRVPDEMVTRLGALDAALDVFPMLPLVVHQLSAWTTPQDLYGRQWHCIDRGPDRAAGQVRVDFTEADVTGVAEVLGQVRAGQFWFDPIAGCVATLQVRGQDRRAQTQTAVTVALRPTASHTATWAARRAEEADRFLRALRYEDRLWTEAINRPENLSQTLSQLDRLWDTFASDVDGPAGSPFAGLAQARRQQLGADADVWRARAALAHRWLNLPARPWSLQDARGRTVTSESLRQGVVIECFWSAESLWGLRALEALRNWPQTPGRPPPRIISYNMDFNVATARQAIERCGAGLTNILGGPLQDVEELPEFPVLRVLDQQGVVRGLWVGWQPTYTAASAVAQQLAEP